MTIAEVSVDWPPSAATGCRGMCDSYIWITPGTTRPTASSWTIRG